jgi:hypothetical protein
MMTKFALAKNIARLLLLVRVIPVQWNKKAKLEKTNLLSAMRNVAACNK